MIFNENFNNCTLHYPDTLTKINPAWGGCDKCAFFILTKEHTLNSDHKPLYLSLSHNDHYNHQENPLDRYSYTLTDWAKYRTLIYTNIDHITSTAEIEPCLSYRNHNQSADIAIPKCYRSNTTYSPLP